MVLQTCEKPFQWKVKEHTPRLKCKAEIAVTQTSTEGVGHNWLEFLCLPCSLLSFL